MDETALGAAIRTFRLRRQQVHNGQPWTLDDLAVAMGADKAHLSRIERGHTLPNQATLLRITRALDLSWQETDFLLRLGGHAPRYGSPEPEAIAAAVRWVDRAVRGYPHPVLLYSVDLRVWHVNAVYLRLAGLTPGQFRLCLRGQPLIESLFAPCATQAQLARRYADYAASKRRTVERFRAYVLAGDVPGPALAATLTNAEFRALWDAAEASLPQRGFPGDQSRIDIEYPGRGRLCFDAWGSPLQFDRRFLAVHQLPRDAATRAALAALRSDPRPRQPACCAYHAASGTR